MWCLATRQGIFRSVFWPSRVHFDLVRSGSNLVNFGEDPLIFGGSVSRGYIHWVVVVRARMSFVVLRRFKLGSLSANLWACGHILNWLYVCFLDRWGWPNRYWVLWIFPLQLAHQYSVFLWRGMMVKRGQWFHQQVVNANLYVQIRDTSSIDM